MPDRVYNPFLRMPVLVLTLGWLILVFMPVNVALLMFGVVGVVMVFLGGINHQADVVLAVVAPAVGAAGGFNVVVCGSGLVYLLPPRRARVLSWWFNAPLLIVGVGAAFWIWWLGAGLVLAGFVGVLTAGAMSVPVRAAHLCGRCGYDLRGNVSGICPECGGSLGEQAQAPVPLSLALRTLMRIPPAQRP